ncbi:MAG: cobyric acid synthase [Candidatus Omnitrophica bacterium]|nr:cobyric acid synthase [Candidatus Omnitrophota bacterium]
MKPPRAKAIMVLGTGSGVGKSFVTAGLCRILSDAGVKVAPFKAQNMSNNSYVTRDGGEMGRAQVVQAECARVEPSVHMNPVLLKPASDNGSQVVVHGKPVGTMRADEYYSLREKMLAAIQESYEELSRDYEALVIEGAGSPAEINLKALDIVNFRVAEMADARCLLVGDIDRGGVFAWILGTLALLDDSERERIAGLVINKFRGDLSLLEPGLRMLENLSGKKVLGVLPYQMDLWIEEEDSVVLEEKRGPAGENHLDIAVLLLPRISNATDFQILSEEPGVSVRMIKRLEEFGSPDLLILPGTKATMADLEYLKTNGFDRKIQDYFRSGGRILGICGGLQMLGDRIEDPEAFESSQRSQSGLSLVPIRTRFFSEKTLRRAAGRIQTEIFSFPVQGTLLGYEIHMGQTEVGEGVRPLLEISPWGLQGEWKPEGVLDATGRVLGTYLHGFFDEAGFRASFLEALWRSTGKKRPVCPNPVSSREVVKEKNYDRLASLLREHLDLSFLPKGSVKV